MGTKKVIRIQEAFDEAEEKGMKVTKIGLAKLLWPESKYATQAVSFSNLISGRTKGVSLEMVQIICEYLNTTPNYLFNIYY